MSIKHLTSDNVKGDQDLNINELNVAGNITATEVNADNITGIFSTGLVQLSVDFANTSVTQSVGMTGQVAQVNVIGMQNANGPDAGIPAGSQILININNPLIVLNNTAIFCTYSPFSNVTGDEKLFDVQVNQIPADGTVQIRLQNNTENDYQNNLALTDIIGFYILIIPATL